ncbi:MAG: diguanylate cyclase domain-containing protein [Gammaproteobacteria bacterium]
MKTLIPWAKSYQTRFLFGIIAIILPLFTVSILGLLFFLGTLNATKDTVDEIIAGGVPITELSTNLQTLPLLLSKINQSPDKKSIHQKDNLIITIDTMFNDILSSTTQSEVAQNILFGIQKEWITIKNNLNQSNLSNLTELNIISRNIIGITEKLGLFQHRLHTELRTDVFKGFKSKNEILFLITMISIFGVLLAVTVSIGLNRTVLKPIKNILNVINQLGLGETSTRIESSSGDDLGEVTTTINQLAEKLENTDIHIKNQSAYDNLTGLINRREFGFRLNSEIERARRYSQTFALLMLDLNNFKSVNKNYGHLAGDETIRVTGTTLSKEIRPMDTVARYNDDKFIIIMPDISIDHALASAARIKSIIANQTIFVRENEKVRVTMNVGVAIYPDDSDNAESLLQIVQEDLEKENVRQAKIVIDKLHEIEAEDFNPNDTFDREINT